MASSNGADWVRTVTCAATRARDTAAQIRAVTGVLQSPGSGRLCNVSPSRQTQCSAARARVQRMGRAGLHAIPSTATALSPLHARNPCVSTAPRVRTCSTRPSARSGPPLPPILWPRRISRRRTARGPRLPGSGAWRGVVTRPMRRHGERCCSASVAHQEV